MRHWPGDRQRSPAFSPTITFRWNLEARIMSLARIIILASVLVIAGAAIFLFWGARQDRAQPAAAASLGATLPLTDIVSGAQSGPSPAPGAYRETAQAL